MPAHEEPATPTVDQAAAPQEAAPGAAQRRVVDVESLHGLAHPLRIQLLERLYAQGPLTASRLAALTGESSGATSYHLRQLARHGFIEEVPNKGTARERWWNTRKGGFHIPSAQLTHTGEVSRDALALVNREFMFAQQREFAAFVEQGAAVLGSEWVDASMSNTMYLRLTAEELAEITTELDAVTTEIIERYRRRENRPGTRPVQMVLNAFPLIQDES